MKSPHTEHQGRNRTALWISLLAVVALAIGILAAEKAVVPQPSAVVSLTLPATAPADDPKALTNTIYGKLPLIFEANRGQTDAQVRFLSRGPGYTLFLTPNEAVFNLRAPSSLADTKSAAVKSSALRMSLVDANPQPEINGLDPLPSRINYYRGQDPQQWQIGVATYGKVQLQGVYSGIDLIYYGNQRQLEYDFVVAPGADPGQIRVKFAGLNEAVQATLADNGDLLLKMAVGELRWHKPVVYQDIAGRRQPVDGQFVLRSAPESASDIQAENKIAEIGFAIAAYDRSQPLVIDPVLAYSTFLGGMVDDYATGIAVDKLGFTYVTGATASANFPGSVRDLSYTKMDIFISRFNKNFVLECSSLISGTGDKDDIASAITLDFLNYGTTTLYITGTTASTTFPMGGPPAVVNGSTDAFVVSIKPNKPGDCLLLSTTLLGGSKDEGGTDITVDAAGNIYVTGYTNSTYSSTNPNANFPTTNPYQPLLAGGFDAFVTKYSPPPPAPAAWSRLYSTYFGGTKDDKGAGIAVDTIGNIYITGSTASTNMNTSGAAYQTLSGSTDAFVAKFNPAGGNASLVYSTYLGGIGADSGAGITVDSAYYAYVTGTASTNFPVTSGAFGTAYGGNGDAFVTKIHPTGSALEYSTYLGGENSDSGARIILANNSVNSENYVYVTGATASTKFPATAGAFDKTLGGTRDAFVAQINMDAIGSAQLAYATYLGGNNNIDSGAAIAIDPPGRYVTFDDGFNNLHHIYGVYVTGLTSASDFPVTPGTHDNTINGSSKDAFVTKLGTAPVDVRLHLICDSPAIIDLPMTCTLTAYNDSNDNLPAPNIAFMVILPATVTPGAVTPEQDITCDPWVMSILTCRGEYTASGIPPVPFPLPAQAHRTITFKLTPHQLGSITISAQVTAAVNDDNIDNNAVEQTIPIVEQTYKLTLDRTGNGVVVSNPSGINCGTICIANFASGMIVSLAVFPATDWQFAGWGGACVGMTGCTVTMAADKTVIAIFKPMLKVVKIGSGTVISSPLGINCGTDCTEFYDLRNPAIEVILTATPSVGFAFGSWVGCTPVPNIPNQCKIPMNGAKTVTAVFKPILTVTVGKGGKINLPVNPACGPAATCNRPYNLNQLVTLTAVPADLNWQFANWGGNCAITTTPSCILSMTAAKKVIAAFRPKLKVTPKSAIVTSVPAGINCGSVCEKFYTLNTVVTLTAKAPVTWKLGQCFSQTPTSCVVKMDGFKNP
ncbi:MAG: SBBP repeat-containing protein [Candidatus Competibacteraceae bacterium]